MKQEKTPPYSVYTDLYDRLFTCLKSRTLSGGILQESIKELLYNKLCMFCTYLISDWSEEYGWK